MSEELERYLSEVARQLNVDPATQREILQEIRVHLEEAAAELQEGEQGEGENLALAMNNFGEAREVGRMLDQVHSDLGWTKVGLAILPGLFALGISSGLFRSVFGVSIGENLAQSGLTAVCVLLIGMGLIRERRFAVWSFPALGILLFGIWMWIPLPFADPRSPFWQVALPVLILFVLDVIGALAVYRVYRQRRTRIPRLAWVLVGFVILVIVAGIITSTIADRSPNKWAALLATLPPTLWWIGMILSPIAIGLPLARRSGLLAVLVVVAAEFVLVDGIFDPGYALGIWTSNQAIVKVVSIIPTIFFLVVSPMWVLSSHSTRGRIWGLLLPVFIALVSSEIISGSVRPYYLDIWPTRVIGAAQFLMALALATVIYHWIGREGPSVIIQEHKGALTDRPAAAAGHDRA